MRGSARCSSSTRAQGGDAATLADADLGLLAAPSETALLRKLADYGPMLGAAAAALAPHEIAFYLRELAGAFHSYYAAERFLVDDPQLARARMALLAATRQIIRNALAAARRQCAGTNDERDGHGMNPHRSRAAQAAASSSAWSLACSSAWRQRSASPST